MDAGSLRAEGAMDAGAIRAEGAMDAGRSAHTHARLGQPEQARGSLAAH
jgi:hypothetical protein